MPETTKIDIKDQLKKSAQAVENILAEVIEDYPFENRLHQAMKYSLLDGGKRIRGVLALWCCEIINGKPNRNAQLAAAALEMVHCYSLIHDDLPAMDDDDLRRGKPSNHKKFDDATAILAGDSLLTYAFEVLSRVKPEKTAIKMVKILADAAGGAGMVAGQMADIRSEQKQPDLETLQYIHTNKTAKMFQASTMIGAVAGDADEKQLEALSEFGLKLGLCFQIADDILDISAETQDMGKTTGKDVEQGKMTYPALMGIEKAKQIELQTASQATEKLDIFGEKAEILKQLVNLLLKRKK